MSRNPPSKQSNTTSLGNIEKSLIITILVTLATAGLTWLGNSTTKHSVNIAVNKETINELHATTTDLLEDVAKNSDDIAALRSELKIIGVRLDILNRQIYYGNNKGDNQWNKQHKDQ